VQDLLGGYASVHGQQQVRGVSVYPHSIVFEVDPNGGATSHGDPLLENIEVDVVPVIGPIVAARAAFRHLRDGSGGFCHTAHAPMFESRGYLPRVVSAFPMPARPTVVSAGPFDEPVQTNLVIFTSGSDAPRLGWLVSLHVDTVASFTVVVSAEEKRPRVLYCAAEAASVSASVFPFSAGEPAVVMPFPRPVTDYPVGVRPADPFRDWVESNQLLGNNVETRIGMNSANVVEAGGVFTPANSLQQQAVNAFFICNFMHDFFSLIGFGEKDGNFQKQNFDGAGLAGDRLIVSVFTTAQGNANMLAQNDGGPARLSLGVWRNDDGSMGQPTSLDAGVVIHEFTHGVSQRLVSGRLKKAALSEPQGLALGEGWSDYFAVTILNYYRRPNPPRFSFAEFASGLAGGVRPHAYGRAAFTTDMTQLGKAPFDEQHTAGSIFAAALIDMHDQLEKLFGDDANATTGQETSWRLVIDSMKVLKANPTFIDARDGLLSANQRLKPAQSDAIEHAIRDAFAHYGMGRNAKSKDTSLKQFTADFTV